MSSNDKAADSRLRRIFNITLAEYNAKLKEQGGGCGICGRFPKKNRLAVDHNHDIENTPIIYSYNSGLKLWSGSALGYEFQDRYKSIVTKFIKLYIIRSSVRGLLCMICNRKVLGVMEKYKIKPKDVHAYLVKHDKTNKLL